MEIGAAVVHRGEEPFFTGKVGVGNVFFNHCTMKCVFCQNYQISQNSTGEEYSPEKLADLLLGFQDQGCPTVGLVSPSHYLPLVAETMVLARNRGLTLPVIWNSNGYETVEALAQLEGLIDIYLPDLKYLSEENGENCSRVKNYPISARAAIGEMYRQVGPLLVKDGLAEKGLAIRHLVLPNSLGDTGEVLGFIAGLSRDISVSLMSQYNPVFNAMSHPLLSRRVTPREYWKMVDLARDLGLVNTLVQEPESSPDSYLPDFHRDEIFRD